MLLLPATFLALGFYMNATLNIPYFFSLAVGKPEIVARSNLYALFLVLPVAGVLIYRFGLAGAGFSWVFYHLFAYAYQVPRTCSECLEIRAWRWYIHVLRIFLLAALTYGTGWLALGYFGSHSVVSLAAAYALASAGFLAAAYAVMDGGLRASLRQLPFLRPQASPVFPL